MESKIRLIQYLEDNSRDKTWLELAEEFGIKPEGTPIQRTKSANDIWRYYKRTLNVVKPPKPKIKRLIYDIETSYLIVKAWSTVYGKGTITERDIIQDKFVICISYKWEDDDTIYTLSHEDGCDKNLLEEFSKVMFMADELVGHNIDKFDTKVVAGRMLKHGIEILPSFKSTDTLKIARRHFSLNSNKLDYLGDLLGLGNKTSHAGMSMWDDIILRNCPYAMTNMVEYCERDVELTEKVYKKLKRFSTTKTNISALNGLDKTNCPDCCNPSAELIKSYSSALGTVKHLMECTSCQATYYLNNNLFNKKYGLQ